MQNVQASLLPFHLNRKTIEVPEGLNLAQIVDCIFPRKFPGLEIVVNIGDQVIPKSQWKSVKPKSHTVIGVNAIAAGGKGKKNPLSMIISIALVVAAPYISTAIAPGLAAGMVGTIGPYTAGQFALAQGLVRIGISMVGFLATSMLSSVPKQRAAAAASPTESSAQFIEGANNKVDRYGVVPVNLGTNRMFPPQGALPYTETSGNNQYVRQIFTYGFGKHVISERRLGETLLSEYDGIEINDRLNGDLSEGVSLYSNDVFQDGYSVLLSNATGYVLRTTQRNTDEAEIDITFSSGLTAFNDAGQRVTQGVDFEIQFSPTGAGTWTTGNTDRSIGAQTVTVPYPERWYSSGANVRRSYGLVYLNLQTGVAGVVSYNNPFYPPGVPQDTIRIASYIVETTDPSRSAPAIPPTIISLIDERASHVPLLIRSGGFAITYGGSGLNLSVAAGTISGNSLVVKDATAQALRISKNIKFPSRGQYDIRIRRLTADNASERIRDTATLTAIRSIRHSSPVIKTDVSGSGFRMLATDQLNGTVNSYNVLITTLVKDWNADLGLWIDDTDSSNCASIYRYVLQSPAFIKRLDDARIDLVKLQEWHAYCKLKNLTYNRIVDSNMSIDDLLNDIAAAGMATPHKVDGIYGVLIDNERSSIKGMVTPRNSWGYNGSITYPDLPHALRVQFRNSAAGYNTDERIVYADGYNESNATLFERLDFPSCTNADLAWFYGRRYLATALLQPEIHTFNMDFENRTFNRGDKIVFVNDTILVGVGQGRIKSLIYDNPSLPTEVTGFTIDDVVNIPSTADFGVRIRYGNGSGFIYHSLNTVVGETDTFTLRTPVPIAEAPPLDSLCAFTEFGKELELIVVEITMNKDESARVVAVNYAPERFTAESGTIPDFKSNITLSNDFYRPKPPQIGGTIQSDESVMLKNSDGSYTGRMIIPLINSNEPSVSVIVSARVVGATQWFRPDIFSATPELLILTGLEDGSVYDIKISYQRQGGLQLLSQPLYLNNTVYVGASGSPDDVTGFQVTSSNNIGLFEWERNTNIDLSHYVIKFTSLTTGASWTSAQILANNIVGNRVSLPMQSGTYLIKAVDILGNESENANTVVSFDNGAFNNVLETLAQEPTWAGTHNNTHQIDGDLYLIDPLYQGIYYFTPQPLDLSEVYECNLSPTLVIEGSFYNRIRSIAAMRSEVSVRGVQSTNVRSVGSIRSLASVRGIDPADWSVSLEIRKSDDNITYTPWTAFTAGKHIFRYVQFRLILNSLNPLVSPRVKMAGVTVDMPDRYEYGQNIACPPSGAIITYATAFKNNPAVNITLQNGATDDRLVFVYKTSAGFHVKVWNDTAAGYVTRSLDYDSSGYGRMIV